MNDVLNPRANQLNGVQTSSSVVEARTTSFVGVLSDISDLIVPEEGNPYFLMTFTMPDSAVKTLPINSKFWDKIRSRYSIDSYVKVSTEHRIADKTSYVNKKTGEVVAHSKSGEYFNTMNRIPENIYTIEVKKILAEDLEHRIVSQDEASKQQALATFYSNFYRN